MQFPVKMRYFFSISCIFLILAALANTAPAYGDIDNNIRDLLDALYQRDMLYDRFNGVHQVVRKAGRSPSLRLRFGRRSDPELSPGEAFLMAQQAEEN
ncbi:short neuropeptide F-like [Coccinella septempunctata]|uniref:short neuropeptide F-like n=1 Tax=Coccinella septempunctata TaxID=41139 RepID=UPI001D083354|nr:short neuropeptide F-like [Coccinella septempunctata]